MKYINVFLCPVFFIFAYILSLLAYPFSSQVYASTYLYDTRISNNVTWYASSSPYILKGYIDITSNGILYIEEGVEIIGENIYPEDPVGQNGFINVLGKIIVNGTRENPVVFKDLGNLILDNSKADISNTHFSNTGIYSSSSTLEMTDVIFDEKDTLLDLPALEIVGGYTNISDSIIKNQKVGIIYKDRQNVPHQVRGYLQEDFSDIGGEGNLFEDFVFNISNTAIYDNLEIDILNKSTTTINASNNWWGGDKTADVSDFVLVNPMLDIKPETGETGPTDSGTTTSTTTNNTCCSNIVFFPGIQASNLEKDENRLWFPNRNNDVKKLFLDDSGESIESNVVSGEIIDKVFGYEVYESFVEKMDFFKKNGLIKDWLSIPYDWRYSVDRLADDSILNTIKDMVQKSKTGKVTLIAHSNGGLLVKRLLQKMDKNDLDEIDKIFFIAVPENGSVKTIATLLHGYGQGIASGLILKESVGRKFAENMISAMTLLPSSLYAKENILDINGENVSLSSIDNFLTGGYIKRKKPDETDIKTPNIININLLNKAREIQDDLSKIFSKDINKKIFSYVGYNYPTLDFIKYKGDKIEVIYKDDGDGTVSLYSTPVSKIDPHLDRFWRYIDLKSLNKKEKQKIEHRNIISSKTVLNQIENDLKINILEYKNTDNRDIVSDHIKESIDDQVDDEKEEIIKIGIHSPANIHLRDNLGNHTGVTKENSDIPSDFIRYEEGVPGSRYESIGGNEYIFITKEFLEEDSQYKLEIIGNGYGSYSISIDDQFIYTDIPVTPNSNDFMYLDKDLFAPKLYIDIDGDKNIDYSLDKNKRLNIQDYVLLINKVSKNKKISLLKRAILQRRVSYIENFLKKENLGDKEMLNNLRLKIIDALKSL